MIAEYERAQIAAQRSRRGKLHRGAAELAGGPVCPAPHGYRYRRKNELHDDQRDRRAEASVVREIFGRYREAGESIG